jgi:acyl carrier protein
MNENTLRQIFAETLGLSVEQVTDDLAYNGVPEWDSIAHMALIGALDEACDTMIDTEDVIDMSSFKKAKEILRKYGVEVSPC